MENSNMSTGFGPFDKTDSDLRVEALRQAVDLWKHWDNNGHPEGDDTTICGVAKSFHDFLTGQQVEAEARIA
jgi:hypothetical protein